MADSTSLGTEWQIVKESNKERLQYLYTSSKYSDLNIRFPRDETIFKAHRLILAISSPVFGAMLMGPLAVGKDLTLPEDSPQALRKLLGHMYLEHMDLASVEEALAVYALAHKYQMESARKACVQYIISNLEEDMTPVVLETSITYEDEALNKKCKEIMNRNPDAVMSVGTVSYLSKIILRDLLKDETLNFSSEVVPFKGLIAWGQAQLGFQLEEPSGSAVREKIGDLLKEVRFLTMSCDEFVDNVVDTNVLTHTECIHILRAIRGANLSTVPEDTPLNPTKTKRYPSLMKKEELSFCELRRPELFGVGQGTMPNADIGLIENLSSSRNIYVHYLDAPSGGTISILDDGGEVIGSANSEGQLFTFTRPVALTKDKVYRIKLSSKTSFVMCPISSGWNPVAVPSISSGRNPVAVASISSGRNPVAVPSISSGRRTVGNVTLSYAGGEPCRLYFSE